MKMIMMLMMMNTLMFSMAMHPLTMGFLLIIQTIAIAMMINILIMNSWFSMIIMIILLGGMLVLFIYMSSIASNEKFIIKNKLIIIMMVMTMFMLISMNSIETYNPMNFNESILNSNVMILNKMFNTKNTLITLMMMLYLMYTMIVINNMVKVTEGPLRKKN